MAISWAGGLVVHGGVDPRLPLETQTPEALQNTRSVPSGAGYDGPFWYEGYEGPPRVFFGHTVLETPVETEWAVGLDTGCVYGGSLSAYDLRRERFYDVPAQVADRPRSEEKIVSPAATAKQYETG